MEEDYAFKIIVIGNENVGKTSMCGRYAGMAFKSDYKPTIGMNIVMLRLSVGDGKGGEIPCAASFWDIAGHERYRQIRPAYYKGASATVLVYDVTKRESFEGLSKFWIPDYEKYGDLPPLYVLIGNKNDLADQKVVTDAEADDYAKEIRAKMFLTISAKTGEKTMESLKRLIDILIKRSNRKEEK